ncbi:MAG: helix-turn-helix transcriptional regulator [Acidobacteria bacterium]|nr:helix-turn-helix transcriptional regulator [Acidobacteriota bacterium]
MINREERMKLVTRNEEMILLAVLRQDGQAYGVSIREMIQQVTGEEWSFASIYEPLAKLARNGLVEKYRGDATPERGGRHKVLYRITPAGRAALAELQMIQREMWADVGAERLTGRETGET